MTTATIAGTAAISSESFVETLERICTRFALARMSTRERAMLEAVLARKAAGDGAHWTPLTPDELGLRRLS